MLGEVTDQATSKIGIFYDHQSDQFPCKAAALSVVTLQKGEKEWRLVFYEAYNSFGQQATYALDAKTRRHMCPCIFDPNLQITSVFAVDAYDPRNPSRIYAFGMDRDGIPHLMEINWEERI